MRIFPISKFIYGLYACTWMHNTFLSIGSSHDITCFWMISIFRTERVRWHIMINIQTDVWAWNMPLNLQLYKYYCNITDTKTTCISILLIWLQTDECRWHHYSDVIMSAMAPQITSLTTVYSTIYSDADQRRHQIFAAQAFMRRIHRCPVNSPHKCPVTRKMFPFHDIFMTCFKKAYKNACEEE